MEEGKRRGSRRTETIIKKKKQRKRMLSNVFISYEKKDINIK